MSGSSSVLVTGASRGFGALAALSLARHGDHVFAGVRDPSSATPLVTAARAEGRSLDVVRLDVTDQETVDAAVGVALERAGRLDAVVNNAGIQVKGAVEDFGDHDVMQLFDTNLLGALRVLRSVLPAMRANRSGTVVNVSSMAGVAALPSEGFYSATKHALEAMSEALYYELAEFGIKVVCIEPGGFPTGLSQGGWTSGSDGSPYAARMEAFGAAVENFQAAAPPADPQLVADAITAAIHDPATPFRVTVGADAEILVSSHRTMRFEDFATLLKETLQWR
jgi:NAD(P)-dependent dehydrogenase (short-subunit alcohol dehydrogenase family)